MAELQYIVMEKWNIKKKISNASIFFFLQYDGYTNRRSFISWKIQLQIRFINNAKKINFFSFIGGCFLNPSKPISSI